MFWRNWRHTLMLILPGTTLVGTLAAIVGAQEQEPLVIGEGTPVMFTVGLIIVSIGAIWMAALLIVPLKQMVKDFAAHTEADRKIMHGNGSGQPGVMTTLEVISVEMKELGKRLVEHCSDGHLREADVITRKDYALFIESDRQQRREEHETLRVFMDAALISLRKIQDK